MCVKTVFFIRIIDSIGECCCVFILVFGFGLLVGGGLLLGFGFYYELLPAIRALIAIPLIPTTTEPCDLYTGPNNGDFSIRINNVYSNEIMNLTGRRNIPQRVWLIHNLWGLNFSVSFAGVNISYERNMDGSESQVSPSTLKLRDFLPDIFQESHRFRVYCGFSNRTGENLGIGDACIDSPFPVLLNGDYEAIELTEATYHYKTRTWEMDGYVTEWHLSTRDLDFASLSVKPKDFLDPPQLYFVSWGSDRPAVLSMRIFGFICLALCLALAWWWVTTAFEIKLPCHRLQF